MPTSHLLPRLTVALVLAAASAGTLAESAAARTPPVPPSQRLVVVERTHSVYTRPSRHSTRVGALPARRPITGERTALPLIRAVIDTHEAVWLRVMLPGRPNGHTGWISARATRPATTPWRLVVETDRRRVTVFLRGRVVRRFSIVVGKPSTPTPHGHFFIEETVQLSPPAVGVPFALALSARSNVLQTFDGGPGQIALHGLGGIGGVPGTAVSHGCLRLYSRSIRWLAARLGPGVPVTITGRR
jgi:lipoprotein-anchoring transpeptidase ErfK/SrfK